MKYLRLCSLGLLAMLASPQFLFACDEVFPEMFPGLLLCRDRGEFYKAARAVGVTQLGGERFEGYPVGVYGGINNSSTSFSTVGEGATFFVQSFAGNHALVSRDRKAIVINFGNVRAVGFDFVKEHPETVRLNSLGWVLSSGFVGFVYTAPTINTIIFDNSACVVVSGCFGEAVVVDNVEWDGGPASSQADPLPPVTCPDSVQSGHCFAATLQSAWYDPPTTTGYRLRALEGKFTSIDDFPTGFSDHFTVTGDGASFGQFGPGQSVDFPGGVTEFTVTGIMPAVDGSNPLAFPIKLSLDTVGATFVMEPLAEDGPDETAPSVTCAEPDGVWHSSDVGLHCTASDEGSGLSSAADASFTLATSTPAGTETANAPTGTRNVCDVGGNCVAVGPIGGNRVDKKGPAILLTSPISGTYSQGAAVAATYTCEDPGSGVSACNGTAASGGPIDTSSAGPRTFTVVASDVAGNSSEATVTYTVATPPRITGSGYNFPETAVYRATFSVNAGPFFTASSVQYSYSRTRMNLVSSSVTSVGVTGNTRTVQGTGTVNGVPGYTFVATATDGSPDAFGIVIRRADGTIHYSAPGLALTGGGLAIQP